VNFIVFGILLLPRVYFLATFTKTEGMVTGFDYGYKYAVPIIEFRVGDIEYNFNGPDYMKGNVNSGQKVLVIYNPKNSKQAYVNNFYGLWGDPFIYLLPFFIIFTIIIIGKDFIPLKVKLFVSKNRQETEQKAQ
jgi:hypothetical protein